MYSYGYVEEGSGVGLEGRGGSAVSRKEGQLNGLIIAYSPSAPLVLLPLSPRPRPLFTPFPEHPNHFRERTTNSRRMSCRVTHFIVGDVCVRRTIILE